MNNPNNSHGMFDNTGIEKLDRDIQTHMSRPTLVSKLKGNSKRKKASALSWQKELHDYWFIYLFLGISCLFTGTLGVYMGLAPYLTDTGLYFQTDVPHWILAFVYVIAFIGVTEVAFALAKWLYFTREELNGTQKWTMLTMMSFAGISIIGTGIAGGTVVASNIAFLTDFIEVPDAAQKWVVVIIPILLSIYTFLVTAYHLSSSQAASERITREQIRERDLDHVTRRRAIEQIAEERLQETELEVYMQLVSKGRLSSAQATAAIRAGKTLGQLEEEMGEDLDDNGTIGTTFPLPHQNPPAEILNHRYLNETDPTRGGRR